MKLSATTAGALGRLAQCAAAHVGVCLLALRLSTPRGEFAAPTRRWLLREAFRIAGTRGTVDEVTHVAALVLWETFEAIDP